MAPRPFDKLDVEDVLSKLTVAEKVDLLTGKDMVSKAALCCKPSSTGSISHILSSSGTLFPFIVLVSLV